MPAPPAGAEPPAGSAGDACTDVRLFVMRGSQEPGAFGGDGSLGADIANGVSQPIPGRLSIRGIPAPDYPATYLPPTSVTIRVFGVNVTLTMKEALVINPGAATLAWVSAIAPTYTSSKNAGYAALYHEVQNWMGRCPNSTVALAGYSQGAHIVGDLTQTVARGGMPGLPLTHFAGALMYGDPAFNGHDDLSDAGSYAHWANGLLGTRDEFASALDGRVMSLCADFDIVCQGSGNPAVAFVDAFGVLFTHTAYPGISFSGGNYLLYGVDWLDSRIQTAPRTYTAVSTAPASQAPAPTSTQAGSAPPVTQEPVPPPAQAPAAPVAQAPAPPAVHNPIAVYNNYGAANAGHAMCRGNPGNGRSMPGGVATQTFTVPAGVSTLSSALVQIDPDPSVTAHLAVSVNGAQRATADAAAAGDTQFGFAAVAVAAGDNVAISINFTATYGKIITVYTAGAPGGTFTAANSCPDGAPSMSTGATGLRAVISGTT